MIYSLKLLCALFVFGGIGAYAFRRAFAELMSAEDYRRAWTGIALATCAVFLAKFPLLLCVAIFVIALFQANHMRSGVVGNLSVFALLAFVLPPIEYSLGGLGDISYVTSFSHFRVLTLALLVVPALTLMFGRGERKRGGFFWVDLAILGYQVLRLVLLAPSSTATTLLRTALTATLDVLIPYYVITRGIRTFAELRFILSHLALGLAFVACAGLLEFALQRNIYTPLQGVYGVSWQLTYALYRGGLVRVQATAEVPINLAVMMSFGLGLWIWLRGAQWRQRPVLLVFAALAVVLAATWSRGPWLAAGVMAIVIAVLSRMPPGLFRVLLLVVVALGLGIELTGADSGIVAFLGALFGSDKAELSTINYRRELLSMSLALIKQSPWAGVPNYAYQLQALRQGEGIIDLVNSYVGIMLDSGIPGLAVYLAPFVIVTHRLLNAIRRTPMGALESGSRFAIAMVGVILGLLFAIFTTSTFGVLSMLLTLSVAFPLSWLTMPEDKRYSTGTEPFRSGALRRAVARPGAFVPVQTRL